MSERVVFQVDLSPEPELADTFKEAAKFRRCSMSHLARQLMRMEVARVERAKDCIGRGPKKK